MYFRELALSHFKNFSNTVIDDLKPGFHFITGPNGSGKSNFLDAVYYLCMTRSFLGTQDSMIVKHGEDYFRLKAFVQSDKEINEVIVKYKLPGIKEIEWGGKVYKKITEHIGTIPVVLIAPDEVYTMMNSHDERRKFLNQTLVQSDAQHLHDLHNYNKLIKQRNAALKLMRKDARLNHDLLDALDFQIAPIGYAIYVKRKELIDALNPIIQVYLKEISGSRQSGALTYVSGAGEEYLELLQQSREKDYFTQRTNAGIHRDQIICMMDTHQLNETGSQGQLKSFVVAMKLAQFNYLREQSKLTPLVLLDDIFAKLDANRVHHLLRVLQSEKIDQCFITDTHIDRVINLSKELGSSAYLYELKNEQLNRV